MEGSIPSEVGNLGSSLSEWTALLVVGCWLSVVVLQLCIPVRCPSLWFVHTQPLIRTTSLLHTGLGSLILQNSALTGTIPTELGRLTELGEFVFYGCTDATSGCPWQHVGLLCDSHRIF